MKILEIVELEKDLNIKARTRGHNLSCIRDCFKNKRRYDYSFFVGERLDFFLTKVAPSYKHFTTKCDNLCEYKRF